MVHTWSVRITSSSLIYEYVFQTQTLSPVMSAINLTPQDRKFKLKLYSWSQAGANSQPAGNNNFC